MNRLRSTFPLTAEDYRCIKQQMLNWANQFSISVFLDSNEYENVAFRKYECLLAVNPVEVISSNEKDALTVVNTWHIENEDWLFGHINYDYKDHLVYDLPCLHESKFDFPGLFFFRPQVVCYIVPGDHTLVIESLDVLPGYIFDGIKRSAKDIPTKIPATKFKKKIPHSDYVEIIGRLKEHIRNGDCYEINFCNEGYAENIMIDPLAVFNKLNLLSPAPFAAYYRHNDQFMICSSPERYLCKRGDQLISQPIKGTTKRSSDPVEDDLLKQALAGSSKDRAENVMIVDLTRNDLSRSCEIGSIEVKELFGIYSYPRVHQMISTVTGILKKGSPFTDALRYSFPMGSMTGTPKVKVMELIEQYEQSKRELFSGTIGYITPQGDFDFNVIIRSLFYNTTTAYLSYQTGGAITFDSDVQQEWEEIQLKALNLERVFTD